VIEAEAFSMTSKGSPTRHRLGPVDCAHPHQGFLDCAHHQVFIDCAHHQGFLDCAHHQVFVQLEANTYVTMLWECDLEHELSKIFHHFDTELILSCSQRVLVDKNVLNIVLEQPASNLTSDGL
jgi:hypothetical protein